MVQLMTTRDRSSSWLALCLCQHGAAAEPSHLRLKLLFWREGDAVWLLHCLRNKPLKFGSIHSRGVRLKHT